MAITKTEGLTGDIVVINYNGSWYGIPLSSLVQIAPAQARYGLNTTNSKLLQSGLDIDVLSSQCQDAIADLVKELRIRIEQMNSPFVPGLKLLIDQNSPAFAALLASSLIL